MPDYRVIADSEVQPDAPVTSSLGFALRDNPAAIAEGAPGAPKVRSEGMDIRGNNANRTSSGDFFTLTGLGRVTAVLSMAYCRAKVPGLGGAGTTLVRYRTSTNEGSTWGPYTTVCTANTSGTNEDDVDFRIIPLGSGVNAIQYNMTISSDGGAPPDGFGSVAVIGIRG